MKKFMMPAMAALLLTTLGGFKDVKKSSLPAVGTEITVTLKGGANAGTFTATSADATCSMGLTGPKSFGNQYSVGKKKDNEFSSLQLIVDDYQSAKSGTNKFCVQVGFGKLLMGKTYIINNSDNSIAGKKEGSGKLTITESLRSKKAHIEGKTAAGVEITCDLTCYSVVTN